MRSSLFPDVNVWLALTHDRHLHHIVARHWLESTDEQMFFCRFTQIGLLRLLTNQQVMGVDVRNRSGAWAAYHKWYEDERVEFHREPEQPELERLFQGFSAKSQPSTKLWADAYLAAFAKAAGLTVVTFDQGFRSLAVVTRVLSP